jgi:hypothetical protein
MFEDFSNVGSYNDAVAQVAEANSIFEGLPSDIREKFDHSVQNLIDFIGDEANAAEAQELGLLPKSEEAPESANLENVAEDSNSATSSEESVTES